MVSDSPYLLDTNILLRLSNRRDPNHGMVKAALDALTEHGADICCTPQNVSEFWNVCTRPRDRNGFGLFPQPPQPNVVPISGNILGDKNGTAVANPSGGGSILVMGNAGG